MNDLRKIFIFSAVILLICFDLAGQDNKFNLQIISSGSDKESFKLPQYKKVFSDSLSVRYELKDLLLSLEEDAFLNASFDSVCYKNSNVKAYLNPGNKYFWLNISFNNVDKSILRRIGVNERLFRNKSIYYNKYLNATRKIISWYENNGYPFISVNLDSVIINNNKIVAELHINAGNGILFDSLNIQGDINISERYLRQYSGIGAGREYNEKLVKSLSRKLEELPFLNEHRTFELEFTPEKAKIYLYLDKRKANSFNGIVALYQRDRYTGKPGLRGELNLLLFNSFGRGEKILLDWKKLESTSQKLTTEFEYPFLFSTPVGFGFKFGLFRKDSSYMNINTSINLQYLFSGSNSFYVFFKNTSSSVLNLPDPGIINGKLADINSKLYGTGIDYKKLDYSFNPQKGIKILGSLGAGNKKISGESKNIDQSGNTQNSERYIEIMADLAFYIPVARKMTIKIRNLSGYKHADNLYDNELFRIGGLKSLRGFEEESFTVSVYNITSLEYRYLFEKNSAFYLFFDAGYYEKPEDNTTFSDTPFGFGVGVDFETRAGIFTLNYAMGRQQGNPVEFSSGKIYFGLVNRF